MQILHGDALKMLRTLPSESVHCIITSPPYWGLRDYKTKPLIFESGKQESRKCRHKWEEHVQPAANGIIHDGGMSGESLNSDSGTRKPKRSDFCAKCGAWRGHLGLEPTPELYVAHLLSILREARRVLRRDGTLWLNLGDSFAGSGRGTNYDGSPNEKMGQKQKANVGSHLDFHDKRVAAGAIGRWWVAPPDGLKRGDLVGIPWRVAFALQADGWFLRRDNIWFKPNPMPESVNGWRWERCRVKTRPQVSGSQLSVGNSKRTRDMSNGQYLGSAEYVECPGCEKCAPHDGLVLRKGNWRCTTSHEYVFQFSKSASYFCDAENAREKSTERPSGNKRRFIAEESGDRGRVNNHLGSGVPWDGAQNRNRRSVWSADGENPLLWWLGENYPEVAFEFLDAAIARKSVWRISTAPYPDAHFATFPPALVRPIILAATSPKCCGSCGAPYAPVIERGEPRREQQLACGSDELGEYHPTGNGKYFDGTRAENARTVKQRVLAGMVEKRVTGYRATCSCKPASAMPATVLDPFGGSGTVGQVALEEGRAAILIELAEHYLPLIKKRCGAVTPKFAELAA